MISLLTTPFGHLQPEKELDARVYACHNELYDLRNKYFFQNIDGVISSACLYGLYL